MRAALQRRKRRQPESHRGGDQRDAAGDAGGLQHQLAAAHRAFHGANRPRIRGPADLRTCEEFASGKAYEGRKDLGNTEPGDGPRYKGRGLLQLTGRANYRKLGAILGVDLENRPELAAEPVLSLRIACEYWKSRRINDPCDSDDLREVTRRVNGGYNGLEDRQANLAKAKAALARIEAIGIGLKAPKNARPVLRRGSRNEQVAELQAALRGLGFPVAIDGDFGAATELAVMTLQGQKKLKADGIVGPATWKALGL